LGRLDSKGVGRNFGSFFPKGGKRRFQDQNIGGPLTYSREGKTLIVVWAGGKTGMGPSN